MEEKTGKEETNSEEVLPELDLKQQLKEQHKERKKLSKELRETKRELRSALKELKEATEDQSDDFIKVSTDAVIKIREMLLLSFRSSNNVTRRQLLKELMSKLDEGLLSQEE